MYRTIHARFLIGILCIVLIWLVCFLGTAGLITYRESFEGGEEQTLPHWSDSIDVIYFINLDHRKDRLAEFLGEMTKMGVPESKLVRIHGVYKPDQGDLGCSLSHCNAIKQFLEEESYKNCIVFEDDFEFTQDLTNVNQTMSAFFAASIPYDVCMLSSNTIESKESEWPFLKSVQSAQTTSGYMVSKRFAPKLLSNYQEGSHLLEQSYSQGKGDDIQGRFCIDQYWKRLQSDNQWFVFDPKWGKQRDSVSDIQGGFVKMVV
jgi:Glycosyltransferase family 25 (LPS biosynthesis protein)